MKPILLFAALCPITACQQEKAAPPPPAVARQGAAPAAKAPVPSLKGQWQLLKPATLDFTIRDSTATLSSGCMRRGFTFAQKGNSVTFGSDPSGSINCGRPPTAAQENAFAALTDVNLALFSADGRKVTLSGLSGTLTMEHR